MKRLSVIFLVTCICPATLKSQGHADGSGLSIGYYRYVTNNTTLSGELYQNIELIPPFLHLDLNFGYIWDGNSEFFLISTGLKLYTQVIPILGFEQKIALGLHDFRTPRFFYETGVLLDWNPSNPLSPELLFGVDYGNAFITSEEKIWRIKGGIFFRRFLLGYLF